MYEQTPVAELNNTMAKVKVVPRYKLMFQDMTSGKFMMRVTCPLTPSGRPLTAYGQHCSTIREAKHSAATVFMNKYLGKKYEEYLPSQAYYSREDEEWFYHEKLEELEVNTYIFKNEFFPFYKIFLLYLQTLCWDNYFDQPMFYDVSAEGPQHYLTWTIECWVSDYYVTEGKGRRKVQARIQAIERMIEILTEEMELYYNDNYESPELTTPASDDEIVTSSDEPKESQPDYQNCELGAQKSESKSQRSASIQQDVGSSPLSDASEASRSPNTVAETLLKWLDGQKRALESKESQHDPGNDLKHKNVDEDSQREIVSMKGRSPCLNTDAWDSVDSGLGSSSSPEPPRQLTRLQAVSGINRILRSFERALHENILSALIHTDLPYRATVRILCQEYVVFIKQDLPPMIFEEHYECSDRSIRFACLTRLLLDLTDRIMKG